MHRDLKLQNLLLVSRKKGENSKIRLNFKVTDFGLAAFVDEQQYIYEICGTPGFIAPEVLTTEDGRYDSKCDIFSIGCILHLLLTSRLPFELKHLEGDFNHYSINIRYDQLKNANQNVVALMEKILRENPKERLSANELIKSEFAEHHLNIINEKLLGYIKTINEPK